MAYVAHKVASLQIVRSTNFFSITFLYFERKLLLNKAAIISDLMF